MYRRGLTLVDEQTKQRRDPQVVFTEVEMAEFVRRSAEANRGNRGGALRFTCDKDDDEDEPHEIVGPLDQLGDVLDLDAVRPLDLLTDPG